MLGLLSPASAAVLSSAPDAGTVQTNGRVQSILQVGNTIYLGGGFTEVNGQQHSKLAAINATTGALIDTWDASANFQVLTLAASPDGSRIYAGGTFTRVNGADRNHLVALDPVTGDTVPAWDAEIDVDTAGDAVYALETLGDRVYIGGRFTSVNGEARTRLAAVEGNAGELVPNWEPKTDGNVRTLVLNPNNSRLYVGGNFSEIGETLPFATRPNLAAVDPVTGEVKSWNPKPRNIKPYEVFDLEVTSNRVFVAGGGRDPDGTAEAFKTDNTGESVWHYWSSGDFQAVALLDGKLYFGGHFIKLFEGPGNDSPVLARRNKFMAVSEAGTLDGTWKPKADKGIWAMTADPQRGRVYAGGDLTRINVDSQGTNCTYPRQGFAQFSSAPLCTP